MNVACTGAYLIHLVFGGVERHISYVNSRRLAEALLKLFLIPIKSPIPANSPIKIPKGQHQSSKHFLIILDTVNLSERTCMPRFQDLIVLKVATWRFQITLQPLSNQ